MRYLPALLLLALAPFGSTHATIAVTGDMGGNIGQVSCPNASSISYNLDQNKFAFHCGADSLNYSCTPTSVDYGTGTQLINLTCASSSGSAVGLVVNDIVDGVQNGNGNSDGFCNNAEGFGLDLAHGKYTWTCNNGNGNTKAVACWSSQSLTDFDLATNQVTMDCVTLFSRSSFEEFEPPPDPQ